MDSNFQTIASNQRYNWYHICFKITKRTQIRKSSSYGQYLTIDEINNMYPTSNPNAATTIQQWIQSTTKDTIVIDTSAHGFITATLPIQVATQLFQEEFIEYQFNDRKVIRSKHMNPTQRLYPNEINHLIDFISGYDYFPIN